MPLYVYTYTRGEHFLSVTGGPFPYSTPHVAGGGGGLQACAGRTGSDASACNRLCCVMGECVCVCVGVCAWVWVCAWVCVNV